MCILKCAFKGRLFRKWKMATYHTFRSLGHSQPRETWEGCPLLLIPISSLHCQETLVWVSVYQMGIPPTPRLEVEGRWERNIRIPAPKANHTVLFMTLCCYFNYLSRYDKLAQ